MDFEKYKKLSRSSASVDMMKVINFEREFPVTAANYKKRIENEQKRRSEIMSITDRRKRLETISRNLSLFGC